MKNMNRKESKKIAVMAAIIMGLMMFAFMPAASAAVTSFTVTPSTGLAGAVDSYNALVTTDGVTSINITIPAGFIGVVPMSGGVELVRITFWNSTKAYYGYATFTANDTNPTTEIDAYFELGGVTAHTTQDVNYNPGATNTFVSNVGGDESSVKTKLPTEDDNGSIEITINCTAFYLDDVMFAIKQFVRNPTTEGDYVFSADGVKETVSITAPGGHGTTVFRNGFWYVDADGDCVVDLYHWYGAADYIPLVGDINNDGINDKILFKDGMWYVDTNGDCVVDLYHWYGAADYIPLVGDINNDGLNDKILFKDGMWYVDTNGDCAVDLYIWYGAGGYIPLVGDINNDGLNDKILFKDGMWYVDTNGDCVIDLYIWYGAGGYIPLVGDINNDGDNDKILFKDGWWYVDTNGDCVIDLYIWFGATEDIPLLWYI
jgi:hypothetical protein